MVNSRGRKKISLLLGLEPGSNRSLEEYDWVGHRRTGPKRISKIFPRSLIGLNSKEEYALSKPFVLKEKGVYKMWYSHRGKNYRLGYAESADGLQWQRMDERVGIDVSVSGWDSEMIEYACLFDVNGERYMLYNGNGYGKTGFGLAVLEKS